MSQTDQHKTHHGSGGTEVLDAALQLFANKGFAATSVREIVLKAGLTKPALYYHFGSKEGLLRAIIDLGFSEFEERVRRRLATATDARDALVKFTEASFEVASQKPELASLVYQVIFGSEGTTGGVDVSSIAERNRTFVMTVIDRAVRDGLIPQDHADTAGLLLSGVVNIHLMAYLKGQLRELTPQLAHQAVDLYLWGVAAPASNDASTSVREG